MMMRALLLFALTLIGVTADTVYESTFTLGTQVADVIKAAVIPPDGTAIYFGIGVTPHSTKYATRNPTSGAVGSLVQGPSQGGLIRDMCINSAFWVVANDAALNVYTLGVGGVPSLKLGISSGAGGRKVVFDNTNTKFYMLRGGATGWQVHVYDVSVADKLFSLSSVVYMPPAAASAMVSQTSQPADLTIARDGAYAYACGDEPNIYGYQRNPTGLLTFDADLTVPNNLPNEPALTCQVSTDGRSLVLTSDSVASLWFVDPLSGKLTWKRNLVSGITGMKGRVAWSRHSSYVHVSSHVQGDGVRTWRKNGLGFDATLVPQPQATYSAARTAEYVTLDPLHDRVYTWGFETIGSTHGFDVFQVDNDPINAETCTNHKQEYCAVSTTCTPLGDCSGCDGFTHINPATRTCSQASGAVSVQGESAKIEFGTDADTTLTRFGVNGLKASGAVHASSIVIADKACSNQVCQPRSALHLAGSLSQIANAVGTVPWQTTVFQQGLLISFNPVNSRVRLQAQPDAETSFKLSCLVYIAWQTNPLNDKWSIWSVSEGQAVGTSGYSEQVDAVAYVTLNPGASKEFVCHMEVAPTANIHGATNVSRFTAEQV